MIPQYLYLLNFPTGSNYICDPPVTNTDIDEMFLVYDLNETHRVLTEDGWVQCGIAEYAVDNWSAYRKGKQNALVTSSKDHFDKFEAATELAKKRNLTNKQDRVKLFNLIVGKQHAKNQEF